MMLMLRGGWAVNYSWAKPKAKIYIFDVSNYECSKPVNVTNPKLAYLIKLSHYLKKEEHQNKLISFISPDHYDLWYFTQAWPEKVMFLGGKYGISNDEIDQIIAPFRELNNKFHSYSYD